MKSSCAIIPARSGSKRIHNKNIKFFFNKPIIAYSIGAALDADLFDCVMVSTNDSRIASVAQEFGAEVPFFRSEENSNDHAGLAEVVAEVLYEYGRRDIHFSYSCCILATAPFVTSELLIETYNELISGGYSTVFPIVKYSSPIERAFVQDEKLLKMMRPENYYKRSQDFPDTYHDAGLFYWIKNDDFLKNMKLYTERSRGYVIDEMCCHDIDTHDDWLIAEKKYLLIKRDVKRNE